MLIKDYTTKYKTVIELISLGLIILFIYVNLIQPFSFETAFGENYVDKNWYDTTFKIDQFQYVSFLLNTLFFLAIWHIIKNSIGVILSFLLSISILFLITSNAYSQFESILIGPAILILWSFSKLKGITPIVVSFIVVSIWSYFSILFLLGSLLIVLLINNKNDLKPGTNIKVISFLGIISVALTFLFNTKEDYFPSVSVSNHFELLYQYDVSAFVLIMGFLFSLFLFGAQKRKDILSYFGLALSILGFILVGFHFLIALSIVFFVGMQSGKYELKSKWVYHLFIYLGCIATFTSTVKNLPIDNRFFEVGITDEQKKIKQVLSPFKINGNVLCPPTDQIEAKFYFGNNSDYTLLNLKEITSTKWSWLNYRMEHSINIVYFNLNNKIYDELMFLGEVLNDSEWALIYHTNQSKAILIRRELKFKSFIQKFEINKSALMDNQQ
jgi:hypothetical protein